MRTSICVPMNTLSIHKATKQPSTQVWYYSPSQLTLYDSTGVLSHTFSNGKGILTFANPVTTVGQWFRATAVTAVSVPDTVTVFGDYAFVNCFSLTTVNVPDTVTNLSTQCFYYCTDLELTKLPSSLTNIGFQTFRQCFKVSFTHIPAGVTTINTKAFNYCSALTTLTFDGTPTSIASDVFTGAMADLYVPWAEGAVANAPWGAARATIHYNSPVAGDLTLTGFSEGSTGSTTTDISGVYKLEDSTQTGTNRTWYCASTTGGVSRYVYYASDDSMWVIGSTKSTWKSIQDDLYSISAVTSPEQGTWQCTSASWSSPGTVGTMTLIS